MKSVSGMMLIALLVLKVSIALADESLVMIPRTGAGFKADITLNGHVVGALEAAIATMRSYKLLSPVGRRADSYYISVAFDSKQEIATFLFLPKRGKDGVKPRGVFEIQVDIRLSDLKMLERRIYN